MYRFRVTDKRSDQTVTVFAVSPQQALDISSTPLPYARVEMWVWEGGSQKWLDVTSDFHPPKEAKL